MIYTEQIRMIDSNDNYNIDYSFINNFFEDEYFKIIIKLFDNKALTYWTDLHYERNNSLLDEIVASYNHLREEEDERDLCFENLVEAFDDLELFDLSLSEVEGLSSKSIDTLIEYNNSIENLKNKFNEIKDELALKAGITKNN